MTFGKIIETLFVTIFFFISTVATFTCLYWLFIQPDQIMNKMDTSVTTNSPINTFEVGKTMLLHRSYCLLTTKYSGKVDRSFTDHIVYQLPSTTTASNATGIGCKERTYATEVPMGLPSGEYDYQVRITYEINPLKTVIVELPNVHIHIKNPVWDAAEKISKGK
jgi:hypothetical protein